MRIELERLNKCYGNYVALNNVTFSLEKGVYGLLGPNGAGKSTLMNCLVGNMIPDSGSIYLNGTDIKKLGIEYKKLLGYMPQQQALYENFTGEQFLDYIAALKGLRRQETRDEIDNVLNLVNLNTERQKKIKAYSGGMKQRILIAQALLGNAKILVLDEPTAGLDPKERIRIRDLLEKIGAEKIVLIATHVISDVDKISKELILIQKGAILRKEKPEKLLEELKTKSEHSYTSNLEDVYLAYFGEE